MLDPAANLKICDFKNAELDGKAFLNKAAGSKGKPKTNNNNNTDPEKAKRASSLQAWMVLEGKLPCNTKLCSGIAVSCLRSCRRHRSRRGRLNWRRS